MDREEYLRKCSNMKCQRVQVDESYAPSLQDDEMEVEHLHAEPRNEHGSMDGNLASHIALNDKDDLELEVLDGFLDDVEIGDLEGTVGFSDACGGFFLDFDFATEVEVLGSGAYEDSLLENSNSESHSPGFSGSSTAGGISDSTNVPNNSQSKCKNDSLDETVTYDTHGVRNNPSQPSNIDCMYNISLDIQHLHELNNDHSLAGGILSCKKENITGELFRPAPSREKRFRKPTQRYIEESSNARSKEKVPTTGAKCKRRSLSSCNELHVRVKGLKKIPCEKSSNGNSDVTLSELQRRKKNPKKEKLEYGNEPSSLEEFEDENLAPKRCRTKDRRKQQRMWTIAEVTKLVDGISEYGVGRWTDIQRFLFSSSYRTPTDIRDKWRNLLRASSAQKFNKKEGEQNDKNGPRLLPFSVASRVLELAKVHPYPRRSKKSRDRQVGSSVIESKDSSAVSFGRRNVRRKKCT